MKGYPFEVPITTKVIEGVVLADQAYTFDWAARKVRRIGRAPESVVVAVTDLVSTLVQG